MPNTLFVLQMYNDNDIYDFCNIRLCHVSVSVIRNLSRQTESDAEQPLQALALFLFWKATKSNAA